jgi:hypothetical protein
MPIRHHRLVRRVLAVACAAGLAGAEEVAAPAAEVSGTVVGPGGEPAAGAVVEATTRARPNPPAQP